MAKKDKFPVTAAIRVLRARKIPHEPFVYEYMDHGGTARVAEVYGVSEHVVIKTLVFETDGSPLIVLMHGDLEVGAGVLARAIGCKKIRPATPDMAEKITGCKPGGISPFGISPRVPVYVEETVFDLDFIYINGGKRGFMVKISPESLSILSPLRVKAGVR